MKKWWFNSILSNKKLEYKCELSKSMESPNPIENTSGSEDQVINNMDKNINNWSKILNPFFILKYNFSIKVQIS